MKAKKEDDNVRYHPLFRNIVIEISLIGQDYLRPSTNLR